MSAVQPDVTPDELVAKADEMRPWLLEEQAATEERTFYSEAVHRAFADAGFYRILVPRRYGGLELGVTTFYRVVMSIARGCPSTGWMFCLGAGHAMQMSSCFSQEAQDEVLGRGEGFVCSASFAFENALATPVDGGYRVSGTWHFCSGVPHATHHMGLAPTSTAERREPEDMVVVLLPREQFRILDNWGDLIGLRGSGSHSVAVEDALLPAPYVIPFPRFLTAGGGRTPGYELHGNPEYNAEFLPFASGELNSIQVGNAQAATDEFERLLTRRTMSLAGPGPRRSEDQDYQRCLGLALGYTDAAYSIIVRTGELYHEHCRRSVEAGEPFSEEKGLRIYGQHMTAAKLCWEAGETVFRAASTTGARDGARMQRYWRDLCAFRANGIHQFDFRAPAIAEARLGLPVHFFGRPARG